MESTKKKKILSNLNETQQAHTLNRLQSTFNTKVAPLQTTTVRKHLNWADDKEIAKFLKDYKIPSPSALDTYKYIYGGRAFDKGQDGIIRAALQKYYDKSGQSYTEIFQKANLLLAQAQDSIIFGDIQPDAVPNFLTKFEASLDALVKSVS